MNIKKLSTLDSTFDQSLKRLLERSESLDQQVEAQVKSILYEVKTRGDAALLEFTQRFDRSSVVAMDQLVLKPDALINALQALGPEQRNALETAAERIRAYHEKQRVSDWSFQDALGNRLGQRVTPLDRVGLYVPGGKAAYPSSVLMNAIPAKVAGVGQLIMVTPAVTDMVLAAAHIAGVDQVIMVGGAQAVAALAYGTETVPRVDKIVGPGNQYVATAKRLVFGQVGIDMIAGPSEVLVVADDTAHPDWVAMDLFAQAEHDESAQSILVGLSAEILKSVSESMIKLLPQQPRRTIISRSLEQYGALIEADSQQAATDIINAIAPEHLELSVREPQAWLPHIRHAGAIFLGHYSAESLGDYCLGPNHVLPTAGSARFSSPLGVYDFQKRSSVIECTQSGAHELGKVAGILADAEQLAAHAQSARYR